ncbi:GDSL esterase/lipase 5-like [Syzygium oleosum]|uniref:GDSL esterase/lipase 5-like n=1 Tax=Syzygium oleosum TaxID=219896 RepID=UPI0024BAAB06|nr:GDSL esterase/lipase 5-like [Syzygium oleosum]
MIQQTQVIMSAPALHFILFAVFASLFFSARCSNQSRKDVALLILGDSLNDAGTNTYLNTTAGYRADIPPYGETFFLLELDITHHFHHPTGRFFDGRLIVDFIAEYAKLPLIPPYLKIKDDEFMGGANFASGGAVALVEDLKMQLKQLEQLEKKLRKEMGSEKSISMDDYVGMAIGNITSVLQGIYKVGGRKFAMIGIGPIGCVPGMRALTRNGACLGEATTLAKLHNIALTSVLTKLETQLHGFEYSYFDFYTSGSERIQYPSKYGFKDAEIACCGLGPYRANLSCGGQRGAKEYSLCHRPKKYVFFDAYHPTGRANRQFAQLMWNGSLSIIRPRNLKALFKN